MDMSTCSAGSFNVTTTKNVWMMHARKKMKRQNKIGDKCIGEADDL